MFSGELIGWDIAETDSKVQMKRAISGQKIVESKGYERRLALPYIGDVMNLQYLKLLLVTEGVGRQWLTPVILATQEAKIRRISEVSPRQIVLETLS
jgi:hypothetical protein